MYRPRSVLVQIEVQDLDVHAVEKIVHECAHQASFGHKITMDEAWDDAGSISYGSDLDTSGRPDRLLFGAGE
jgi:hypothetical protein